MSSEAKTLERHRLPADVKGRLDELRELSGRAEDGDGEARQELRRELLRSGPEVIARASDVGRKAQHMLIGTTAGGDPLTEYALSGRLDMMREEIAGENPTPLEVLLTERVVACWILVETFEVLMTAQLALDGKHRVSVAYLKHMIKWQESANRRYLSSIRELARVRKLQSNTPGVQFNIQNNVLSGGSEAGKKDARERDPRNAL